MIFSFTKTRTGRMTKNSRRRLAAVLALAIHMPAISDPETYEREFIKEVVEFANLNRLNLARLHRDVHANCFIPVTVGTVIRSDGSVRDVFIVKSSTVPVVDRYFLWVVRQAAPFQPLANHFDPVPDEITVTHEHRLDAQLWGHGIRSTRACEELKPPGNSGPETSLNPSPLPRGPRTDSPATSMYR